MSIFRMLYEEKRMNLNKEERLKEVRNILIGSQISGLDKRIKYLETAESGALENQLKSYINNTKDFIKEELGLLKQSFEHEQNNYSEKINLLAQHFESEQIKHKEAHQQVQDNVKELNYKFSELESKLGKNQGLSESSFNDLEEVNSRLNSLRQDLNYQDIEHKNAYEHLTKSLQEFSRGWIGKLTKLEQEMLKRNQALQEQLLTSSSQLSNDLQKLKETFEESNLKPQLLTQLNQVAHEIKSLEHKALQREKNLEIELLSYIKKLSNELRYYREDLDKKLASRYSPNFLLKRLWLWPWSIILRIWRLLNGRKRK